MTYPEAVTLAQRLKTLSPIISSIELFGSTLKNGQGRDADFLILVDDERAKRWWQEERESIRVRWPDWLYGKRWVMKLRLLHFLYVAGSDRRRRRRLDVAAKILGLPLEKLADAQGLMPDFEMFLMPANWRTGKEVNLNVMSNITDLVRDRNTLGFLGRIATDAVKLA